MPKIFISYRRADSAMLATHLAVMLKSHNIDAYVDTRNTDGGGPFPNRLYRAIEDADVFVCLLGSTTLKSEWVRKEIEHAHNSDKVLIPVFQERYVAPNPIPDNHIDALLQSDGVHFLDVRNLYIEAAISALAEMIQRTLLNASSSSEQGDIQGDFVAEKISPSNPADASPFIGIEHLTDAILTILPPPFEWCFVPSGNVTLNTDPPKVYLLHDFAISKYTITNAQFQVFLNAKRGYRNPDWWNYSTDAQLWRAINKSPRKVADFADDNVPRTNINWYEGVAFTHWLSSRLATSLGWVSPSKLPRISLPSEQQWQRAAQGDTNWKYPWGNDFKPYRCNTKEALVGQPVAVTHFSEGVSPFGVFNMSGNVYEFCLNNIDDIANQIDSTENHSVLRGGSFVNDHEVATCTSNIIRLPDDAYLDFGFRIVLSYNRPFTYGKTTTTPSDSPQSPPSHL